MIGGAGDDIILGIREAVMLKVTERRGFGKDAVQDFKWADVIRLPENDDVDSFVDLHIVETQVPLKNGSTRTDDVIELANGLVTLEGIDFALEASNSYFV